MTLDEVPEPRSELSLDDIFFFYLNTVGIQYYTNYISFRYTIVI